MDNIFGRKPERVTVSFRVDAELVRLVRELAPYIGTEYPTQILREAVHGGLGRVAAYVRDRVATAKPGEFPGDVEEVVGICQSIIDRVEVLGWGLDSEDAS